MKKIINSVIPSLVILSLLFFFINEWIRVIHCGILYKKVAVISGLILDILFCIDFTINAIQSRNRKGLSYYIGPGNGWADLISSFPPLLLDSVPSLLLIFSGYAGREAVPVFFMTLKAAGIAELLRFFRITKVLQIFKITDSEMAVHHISVINTIALSSILTVYIIFSAIPGNTPSGLIQKRSADYTGLIDGLKRISDMNGIGYRELSESMLLSDRNILKIFYINGTVIEKLGETEFERVYGSDDYIQVTGRACKIIVSVRDINAMKALSHLQVLVIIIVAFMAVLFIYSLHFTRNISDVAHILNMGFRRKDYNLLVRIPDKYKGHEIFRLSRFYNDAYLPAKIKKIMKQENEGHTTE